MNGYGSHTFKMVNENNEAVYVKFHFKTDQAIKLLVKNIYVARYFFKKLINVMSRNF